MPRVRILPRADEDLLDIWCYIARDSAVSADSVIDRLSETFDLILGNPEIGHERKELAAVVRSFPSGAFLIFYRRSPDGVDIVRMLHGARDFETEIPDGEPG